MSDVTIGSYDVIRRISDLPHGVLYAARDQLSQREVLLKKLQPTGDVCDTSSWQEYLEETQRLVEIEDPRIGGRIAFLEEQGDLFLVMSAPEGKTLRQRLAESTAPSEREASAWIVELLSLLETAHDRGVVHGHLDETSLIFDREGRLHLFGFSLSAFSQEDPLYRAPERSHQATCQTVQIDVYGVGMILLRLLEVVSFSQPDRLEQVAATALAAEPNQRFQTVAEMREALGYGDDHKGDPATSLEVSELSNANPEPSAAEFLVEPREPRSRVWLSSTVGIAAMVALAGGWWLSAASDAPAGVGEEVAVEAELFEPQSPEPSAAERALTDHVQALIEQGQTEEAAAELEVALHTGWAGNPAPVLDLLGTLRLQQGRIEEASDLLERANALQPTAERRYKYGLALAALGQPALAVEQFQQAHQHDPSDRLALVIDRALTRIKKRELSN
ncbi:MAG: hypothetical protein K8J08_05635 [Thermoanaerobaculia bacterium]|nr:hypothetical protein [Thermoanaerobaculia bacterium]